MEYSIETRANVHFPAGEEGGKIRNSCRIRMERLWSRSSPQPTPQLDIPAAAAAIWKNRRGEKRKSSAIFEPRPSVPPSLRPERTRAHHTRTQAGRQAGKAGRQGTVLSRGNPTAVALPLGERAAHARIQSFCRPPPHWCLLEHAQLHSRVARQREVSRYSNMPHSSTCTFECIRMWFPA